MSDTSWTVGDISGSETLTSDDHLYETHINELRTGVDVFNKPFLVVGTAQPVDYLCDGTADDVQIQTALDAANTAGGGIVFIKEGTYDITAKLLIYSNTWIIGEGWGTILKSGNAANITLLENEDTTDGNTNIQIKDLQIDMNKDNNTTLSNKGAIKLWQITKCKINNVYIHDMRYAQGTSNVGIGLANPTDCVVSDCYLDTISDYGIATDNALRCIIKDNIIIDPSAHGISLGFNASYSNGRPKYNLIEANVVLWTASGLADCNGAKMYRGDYNKWVNNTFYNTNKDGARGITTGDDGADTVKTDQQVQNQFKGNFIYGFNVGGVYVNGALGDVIEGNSIYMKITSGAGIFIRTSNQSGAVTSKRCVITDNYIEHDTTSTADGGSGITIDSVGTGYIINNNNIYYSCNTGIYLGSGVNKVVINNNHIYYSYRNGIAIGVTTGSSYCSIVGNILEGNSRVANNSSADIYLGGTSTYNTISGNVCESSEANKVKYNIEENGAGCDYNIITDNIVQGGVTGAIGIQGANDEIGHNIGY